MTTQDIPTICLTFKYRLLPTKRQHAALRRILDDQRALYNAALQERIEAYRKEAKSISFIDQCKSLTVIRGECDGWNQYPTCLQRGTLKRLDEAFKGFFSRVKRGDKPGFPRFRGKDRFNGFEFTEFSGVTLKEGRIKFKGMPGSLGVHFHRPLPGGKPLTVKFTRDTKGWYVCLVMRAPCRTIARPATVGIDVGISHLATLSTGEHVPNPKAAKRAQKQMRVRQRALARCKRGSNRRKKVRKQLARCHATIRNTRNTYLHQVSSRLTQEYGVIAVEKLQVKNMVKNHHLAHAIHDAAWIKFKEYLSYKAAYAGGEVIEVNPHNTSQECSGCGEIVRKTLTEKTHRCPHCGLIDDRDVNAARVILTRGGTASQIRQCSAVAQASNRKYQLEGISI